MKVNILLREWQESNSYDVKVLGVFKCLTSASKVMNEEIEQSQGDGWLILRKTAIDAELYNGQTLIKYSIINQKLE